MTKWEHAIQFTGMLFRIHARRDLEAAPNRRTTSALCRNASFVPPLTRLPDITAIYGRFVETSTATFEIVAPDQSEMRTRRQAVLNQALPYLVAELEGYVVGFCYASQFRPREGYRYTVEDSIYVRADCIGHGVGKALLSRLISECQARGCHSMVACVCGVNVSSVALHASLGFQQAGLLAEAGLKFGKWLQLLIMQRPLQ